MTAQTNIFQRLASENNSSDFSVSIASSPTEFSETISTDNSSPSKNIFEEMSGRVKEKKDNNFGFLDTLKDIGEQVSSKAISGGAGAYGNILDAFGLQLKEGEMPEAVQQKQAREFNTLEKLNRGEVPSIGELMELSDDGELPSYYRLPSSEQVKKGIETTTGVGEGKTPAGRIAGRGSEFVAETAATGGGLKTLAATGLSGLAGQGIREAGGPEGTAVATEVLGSIIPSAIQGKVVPTGREAKQVAEAGRKIGLTEKQITPLIQSEKKAANLSKIARKGNRTKKTFASIKESLGDSYNNIKNRPQASIKLPNAEQINLRKEFGQIRNELSKTLAPSPDKEAALNFIEKSLDTLRNVDITPEYLVNFWQDINKAVKWNSITGGKKALARLKQPISESLKKAAPDLAEDFELTNQLYSKYAQISKKLKPDLVDAFVNKAEVLAVPAAGVALASGNPWALAGIGSEIALRSLGREMLINPYFQNLATKLVTNFNQGSLKAITESVNQAKQYLERKYPEEDWSFLIED